MSSAAAAAVPEGLPDPVTRISPLRRTFCLVALFDFLFTIILWIFDTRNLGLQEAFKQQVLDYQFKSSVFDLILISFSRFVLLEICYAAMRIKNPWVVAFTTAGSTAFVIVKVIFYDFVHGRGMFDYLLPLVTLILVWAETFLLDCKVLPTERAVADSEAAALLRPGAGERGYGTGPSFLVSEGFRTPESSPDNSDTEEQQQQQQQQQLPSTPSGRVLNHAEVTRFLQRADRLAEEAWQCLTDTEWKCVLERGDTARVLCQRSRHRAAGKAWRLETQLELAAERLFVEIWDRVERYPEWNRNVLFSRLLARLDANTTIVHNATAEAGGGLVKARDFVTLCVRRQRDSVHYTGGVSVDTELEPSSRKYTRAENLPGCVACVPLDSNSCRLVWVMDSDLKGWLPATVVDQAMTTVLSQLATSLQQLAARIAAEERHTIVIHDGQ